MPSTSPMHLMDLIRRFSRPALLGALLLGAAGMASATTPAMALPAATHATTAQIGSHSILQVKAGHKAAKKRKGSIAKHNRPAQNTAGHRALKRHQKATGQHAAARRHP